MKHLYSIMTSMIMISSGLCALERSERLLPAPAREESKRRPCAPSGEMILSGVVLTTLIGSAAAIYAISQSSPVPPNPFLLPDPDSLGSEVYAINAGVHESGHGWSNTFAYTCDLFNTTSPEAQGCPPSVELSFGKMFRPSSGSSCNIGDKTCPCRSTQQVKALFPRWCQAVATPPQEKLPASTTPPTSTAVRLKAKITALENARKRK